MPYPLPGTLNAMGAPPPPVQTGLVIPGRLGSQSAPPQREMSLGEIIGKLGGMAAQTTSVPRDMLWGLGPALVGRPGQGPQNGAELFGRLGLDPNSPTQRALGQGLGKGLDLLADPANLIGMGGRANPLTTRLEQYAGPMNPAALRAAGITRAATPAETAAARLRLQQTPLPSFPQAPTPPPSGALSVSEQTVPNFRPRGDLPFSPTPDPIQGLGVGMRIRPPTPPGTPGSVASFGHDADALRSMQLNSPRFNPDAPVFGLGTPQFTQDAGHAAQSGLLDRLRRMAPQSSGSSVDY